jgi:predicted pyridoxine 5'-phosphate oxidase superfamily flavin-nucleotide-binding protein
VQLTADMQRVVLEQKLGFVATVTPDGRPNLSPKGTTTVLDDEHLMFVDVASPGTVANLASNPFVEINVVDPIVRTGYRFKGSAVVYTDGAMFEQGLEVLRERGSSMGRDRVRSIVVVEVTDAARIVSPAYDDGTAEAAIAAQWLGHYRDLHGEAPELPT